MKRILALSIIAFVSIFLINTTSVTAGGKPFEALQQQIDDLQEQIDNLQAGLVKAYFTADGDITLNEAGTFVPVLELNLPEGSYVSNMALSVSASPSGEDQNYLDCQYMNDTTDSPLSGLFGLNVGQIRQLAHTYIFELIGDNTKVVLTCAPINPTSDWVSSKIYHAEWTVIKVGEIESQPSP